MNKLLSTLVIALSFNTVTAFADDPLANFPTQWLGSYRATGCASVPQGYTAKASMSTATEIYNPDKGYGSEVYFTGTLNLDQWPKNTAYSFFESPIPLRKSNSTSDSFVKVNNGYNYSYLYSADNNANFVGGAPSGYNPDSKVLVAEYDQGGCQVVLTLTGQ